MSALTGAPAQGATGLEPYQQAPYSEPKIVRTAKEKRGVYFGDIPASEHPLDAHLHFRARAQKAIDHFADLEQGSFGFHNSLGFWITALAKLQSGRDVEAVNRALLSPSARVYARVGSDFQKLGFLCRRSGDYDFMLRGLVQLMYYFGDDPTLIWPETRHKLLHQLLNQRGNKVHTRNFFILCGWHAETENHILMTEGSRFLTNQLLLKEARKQNRYQWEYDNLANGMADWLLRYLQTFFKHEFSEYNSRPYQTYTVMALQNLYEFSEEPRVKLAAEMLLNYLDAKFAVSSNALRRHVPFRRQPRYKNRTDMLRIDSESQRFIQLAGNTQLFDELPNPQWLDFGLDRMMGFALGTYRTPELILSLVLSKEQPYYQRFRHQGLELYASNRAFLISAGGIHIDLWDVGTGENDGWPVHTTLMPSSGGLDASQFIRIEGPRKHKKRINTCVAPGFACGLNPVVPPFIPPACIERRGHWQFVNLASSSCPLAHGFYVALHEAPCDTKRCRGDARSFGFFEAAEATRELSYESFRDRILAANGSTIYRSEQLNEYTASDGRKIRFQPLPRNKWQSGLYSIQDRQHELRLETNATRWRLAEGDIINADGSGLITIDHPLKRRRITLDMRDPLQPKRTETAY